MTLSIAILTGQSGSGKSTAIHALEDRGYLCVDNLPAGLAEQLIEIVRSSGQAKRLALVMDVRQPRMRQDAPALVERLRDRGESLRLVYLESREESIIRRYSETRRRHPLDSGAGLRAAISAEREVLAAMRELADETIDTTGLTPHQLRDEILAKVAGVGLDDALRLAFVSFGFKHGPPTDADMTLDVRFLPNPYFVETMRQRTGLDGDVREYVLGSVAGAEYVNRTEAFLAYLLPHFQAEGKRYLTVAVGCTGGQHRSVSVVSELGRRFAATGVATDVRHRDVAPQEGAGDGEAGRACLPAGTEATDTTAGGET